MAATASELTHDDARRALALWTEYCKDRDLSDRQGQAAGIDPFTGRIWFGESALDIVDQMRAQGEFQPLYYITVGEDFYWRKGALA